MLTIEIDKKPAIFDDAELCSSGDNICRFIRCGTKVSFCRVFWDEKESWIELERVDGHSIKCHECKEAWKLAKDKQPKLCPVCDKPRGISDIGGGMVTPCPHCGDEVSF